MADEGQPLVEDVSLRYNTDLYSELQSEIIWLQGEITKLTDGNPCKPALIAMLESLEKMVKDFKEAGHEEDIWERIQLEERASVEGTVKQTIRADMQQTLHSMTGIVSSQTRSTGPFDSGGYRAESRPSHGDRSCIPWYFFDDEVHHMSVEDLRSLYFECRDYIHGTDVATRECGHRTNYVDSTYEMEHGQALFLDAIVDDACGEYATSTSMPTEIFLESSIATAYERVGGAGPSREFKEPWVDLMFDLIQRWPSYTGPKTSVQIKHSKKPCVVLPSYTTTPEAIACPYTAHVVFQTHDSTTSPLGTEAISCPNTTPVVSQTHDSATSPLGAEVTKCPNTSPMPLVAESVLGSHTHNPTTSPLGLEVYGIDGHRVIGRRSRQINEDLEDGNRSQ
eukprot:Gb_31091 [translate_table: standard]